MKEYSIKNLRNVGIIGHNGTGKTTLIESILYSSKAIDRLGSVDDGTTVSDFDAEEKKRKISISLSVAPVELKDKKINFIDIPGYSDFQGEFIQGMNAADIGLIVVSGVSGIKAGTEKAWEYCNKCNMPKMIFINKLDRENSSFDKVLEVLKSDFGNSIVPLQYPIGSEDSFKGVVDIIAKKAVIYDERGKSKTIEEVPSELEDKIEELKESIIEAAAENDEELLEKYFKEGTLSDDEIYVGLLKGCANGEISPVLCGSASKVIGLDLLTDSIVKCFPSPENSEKGKAVKLDNNEEITVSFDTEKPFSAQVFKTIADPFVGKISFFKVITGTACEDMVVFNSNSEKEEKLSHICFSRGKTQIATSKIGAGDIGAISKLQYTNTGDTLCVQNYKIKYDNIAFNQPVFSMAVLPKAKGDEEKISQALSKLNDEDPSFVITRDIENAEIIVSGAGETQLDVVASKIKDKFGVDVNLTSPKIPYKETIKGVSDVQGKHKKQSGGHGQYGDVVIKFEPRTDDVEDLEFVDKVVGGAVPRNFIPAVEKGLRECIAHGVLAGCPVIGLRATLHDGSYHPVDSSEMAFKMAASIAYKKGLEGAKPVLLEPISKLEVLIPDDYMGDVIGDINRKRGRIIGLESEGNKKVVVAEVPLVEISNYATELKSMTQGRGSFSKEFVRYEEVPASELEKAISNVKDER